MAESVSAPAQFETSVVFARKVKKLRQWQPHRHSTTQQLKLLLMLLRRLAPVPEAELVEFPLLEFLHLCQFPGNLVQKT
jgi:hypothetical protein